MTPEQTAALLARILEHPRVKAYGEGRGWYSKSIRCPECGFGLASVRSCDACDATYPEQAPQSRYTGPDLGAESNLNELLGLADALNGRPISVDYFTCPDRFQVGSTPNAATGPTRTLAVIAALGRALGIETPTQGKEDE